MAYGRRRSTYRRKGRRGSRALSTRRIFNNKSAKAQAKQIYALRRSINRVRSQCRPEIKVIRSDLSNRGLSLYTGAGLDNYSYFDVPLPAVGTGDSERVGNKITILSPKLFIGAQYNDTSTSPNSLYKETIRNTGIQIRLVAIQARVAHSAVPNINEVFQNVNFGSQINSMMMMREPFKIGITSRFNILMDRHMTLTKDSPTKSYRFSIKPKTRVLTWEDGLSRPKGAIYVFMLQGGSDYKLFVNPDPEEDNWVDYNKVDFTWRCELPYTDA